MKTKALTEANVELLCSYIKKTYTEASDFIDDNNVKTNGTYSSKKIEDVNESIRTELKKYADDLVKGIITVKTEVLDEQPTLDNTVPNTIYLFQIDTTNHIYQQYLRTDTLLVELGTTQVDLTNYVTNVILTATLEGYSEKTHNHDTIYRKIEDSYSKDEIDTKNTGKQDKLKAGTNITISDDNTISATEIDDTKSSTISVYSSDKSDKTYESIANYNMDKGTTDISTIGDGTFTGAIGTLNTLVNNVATDEDIASLFS